MLNIMGNINQPKCPECEKQGIISQVIKDGHVRSTLIMPISTFNNDTSTWNTTSNTFFYNYKCQYDHKFTATY
jgi:hypothetical protein